MLMLVLFVTTVIVSVSDVKAAESDNDMSICAAENHQGMACGQDKCDGCDKQDECDKKKEDCDKEKEGCGKSGEKKGGCGKKAGCGK